MSTAGTVTAVAPVILPVWIVYLQALAVPAVAMLAAIIGFMQWRTAHSKIVLDLFDRRYDLFIEITRLAENLSDENNFDTDDLRRMEQVSEKMIFLFGREVSEYFKKLSSAYNEIYKIRTSKKTMHPDEFKREMREANKHLHLLYMKRFDVMRPYLGVRYRSPI